MAHSVVPFHQIPLVTATSPVLPQASAVFVTLLELLLYANDCGIYADKA